MPSDLQTAIAEVEKLVELGSRDCHLHTLGSVTKQALLHLRTLLSTVKQLAELEAENAMLRSALRDTSQELANAAEVAEIANNLAKRDDVTLPRELTDALAEYDENERTMDDWADEEYRHAGK